jgi:hypothetical protein
MNRLLAIDFPQSERKGIDTELPMSRIALRRILLEGRPLHPLRQKVRRFRGCARRSRDGPFEDGVDRDGRRAYRCGQCRLSSARAALARCLGGPRPGF